MTDHTNAELIAEAGHAILTNDYERAYHGGLVERLAAALEAAEQRATELAAVVEKVRSVIERESGWYRYRAEPVSTVLASAPADVLREHDAKVRAEALREFAGVVREVAALGPENTGLRKPAHLAEYAANYADRIERETGLK